MCSKTLFLTLAFHCLLSSQAKVFTPAQISKIFEGAVKVFPFNVEFPAETLKCWQKVSEEDGKKVTKYFLVASYTDEPDGKGVAAFTRKRDDTDKPWIYINKVQDHLYTWEKQTIVVLRQSTKNPKVYIALMVYFREIGNNQFVFEWDKWKPRGPLPIEDCPCTMVDKFYHPCEDWDYCKLVANVYEQSGDASSNATRRRRRDAPEENDHDSVTLETGNEIPKGSNPTFGPFFWDIVDTAEEAETTATRVKKFQQNKTTSAKYYNDENDNAPFSGYGDCPYEVKDDDFKKLADTKDSKKMLDFLIKSIKAQCLDEVVLDVKGIISSKLLQWNATLGHFVFNRNHTLRTKAAISDNELEQLELALHFSTYSFLYPTMAKRIEKEKGKEEARYAVTPFGKKIHRNTRMVVLMALRVFDMIRTDLNHHEIKLTRRLLANLKSHLMLGLHSKSAFKESVKNESLLCTGEGKNNTCVKTKELLKKDTLQPVVLTYFILFGNDPFAPPEEKDMDTYVKFVNFYQYRIKFLEHYFNNYWK